MHVSHSRLAPHSWSSWPRHSARLRLTALCGGLFLVFSATLLGATYILFERATRYKTPRLPKIPGTPAIRHLQPPLAQAQERLALAQHELAQALPTQVRALPFAAKAQNQLARGPSKNKALAPLAQAQQQLAQAYHQLAHFPNRLVLSLQPVSQAQREVALAIHQVAQAVPALAHAQAQLSRAQQHLAQAQLQLSEAVHQVAQAGSAQAAQRAADSHQLLVNSAVALAIVAVLALLAGWLVAGRILRPIRTITRTARRISSAWPARAPRPQRAEEDELKQLGDTLDDLFARLEAAFEAQRRFVANASHELRTPLTRERTLVQVRRSAIPSTSEGWRSTAEELLAAQTGSKRLSSKRSLPSPRAKVSGSTIVSGPT